MSPIYNFISGAVMLGCWVVALFFLHSWRQTKDRIFQIFSFAFAVLGVERAIPIVMGFNDEPRTFVYVIRLIAFLLILTAIANKNRKSQDEH